MKNRFKDNLQNMDDDVLNTVVEFLLQLTQIKNIRAEKGYGLNTYDNDFLINYIEDVRENKIISLKRKLVVLDIVVKYHDQIFYLLAREKLRVKK